MTAHSVTWGVAPQTYHGLRHGPQPPGHLMLHANGFNGGTYLSLLAAFDQGGWLAPDFRGHGQSFVPPKIRGWKDFVDDVIVCKNAGLFDRPIAIGHSLGGMTALMAEAFHPGTFRAIVLLDPVIFPPRFVIPLAITQLPLFRRMHPLVKGALLRRMDFPSREAIVASYAKKKTFAAWQTPFLENYIEWGTQPNDQGGVRLSCSGAIEAQIFSTWPVRFWFWISRVKCPVLILRGATSDTFWPDTAIHLQKRLPRAELQTIPGTGHFLPMEQPAPVIAAIRAWEEKIQPHVGTSK